MNAGHTAERLKLFTLYAHPEIRTEGDEVVATLASGKGQYARRLLACWNACAGISTEALESEKSAAMGWVRTATKLLEAAIRVDELLAALIVAREFISTDRNSLADSAMYPDGRMDQDDAAAVADYDAALLQIDAAIQAATGSTPT